MRITGATEIVMSYSVPSTPVEHNDLDQLKRQAKELHKALKAAESTALELARTHYHGALPAEFQLTDAQLIIARHHGLESWAKLRAEVDAVNLKCLVTAVQTGNTKEVQELLKKRPVLVNFDMAENNEHRVLHYAVLKRDEAMVRLLVKAGADAHKGIYPHREATTAIGFAKERNFPEIVAAIEEEEAHRRQDMNCLNATISSVHDQLASAVRQGDHKTALALLDADPTMIRACDRHGCTALHIACEAGAMPVIDWLLEHQADCRKTNLRGRTPLEHVVLSIPYEKRRECVARFPAIARKLIRQGAEIKPLIAAALGDNEILRDWHRQDPQSLTEDHKWGESCGVMAAAVLFGQTATLKTLLDLGLDPDEPQHLANVEAEVISRGGPLSQAASNSAYEIAELLLAHGADPNAVVYASGSAMGRACRERDERMLALLKKFGGRPSAADIGLYREIEDAKQLLQENPPEEIIDQLLWGSACGGSPEIVRLCLARLHWPPSEKRWPTTQPLRIWNHSPINPYPERYDRSTYPECLRLLLAAGADPNNGRFGTTLMHNIAAMGKVWGKEVMTAQERQQFAQITLRYKPDLTLRDDLLSSTPLGWACRWGRTELVKLLVENGAPVNEPDAEPWATPLAWATKSGREEIKNYLVVQGADRNTE